MAEIIKILFSFGVPTIVKGFNRIVASVAFTNNSNNYFKYTFNLKVLNRVLNNLKVIQSYLLEKFKIFLNYTEVSKNLANFSK